MKGQVVPKDSPHNNTDVWINAFQTKTHSPGSFLNATAVTETILLGVVALRAGRKVEWDSANENHECC